MPSSAERVPDRFQLRWTVFVDGVTVVWLAVFLTVLFHVDHPVWRFADAGTVALLEQILGLMTVLFVIDLVLHYRWSGLPLRRFLRVRWSDVLMAIPFMRPLRALRIFRVGRVARVFGVLVRGRKLVSLYRKSKRVVRRAVAPAMAPVSDEVEAER